MRVTVTVNYSYRYCKGQSVTVTDTRIYGAVLAILPMTVIANISSVTVTVTVKYSNIE